MDMGNCMQTSEAAGWMTDTESLLQLIEGGIIRRGFCVFPELIRAFLQILKSRAHDHTKSDDNSPCAWL